MIKYFSNNCLSPRIFYFSGTLVYGDKSSETANEESIINPTSFSREYYIAEKPFYDELLKSNENISMLRLPWVVVRVLGFITIIFKLH